jgi:hypothetical protein
MEFTCRHGCTVEITMSELHDRAGEKCEPHGEPLRYGKALKRSTPLARTSTEAPAARRRGSTLKRGRGFAVTPAQREKVAGLPCINCGREQSEYVAIDPAHLWPRGRGGCDDPLCVGPLCRDIEGGCHREFDLGHLDLLPKLIGRSYFAEIAHMISAHELSPLTVLERLTGESWQPVSAREVVS